ncbi:MAG: aspartate aminotransferase family protein [Acidobacteria bacterium]|jgi:adenosylmethionine-8-amino-7-oxononanoate aminotransferase|nr:aspartate aminotransferase family protein [Acidobacteriota bacterium]MDP7479824.1 aspartate aminotransferase family protein [Vicinamibacterales bacterium]HJN46872.1 aspartate aminotransferase family protein [Vicinamibacterales bacterium]
MPNQDLIARDTAHLIHPLHSTAAHQGARVWVKGHGAVLTDADGRDYIDGLAGLWNVLAGHGRRELAEAARAQCETLAYASGYTGSSNERAIELGEHLAALTYPSINRFFFTSGGGEATESSIKMARAYWKLCGRADKTKVISRIEGYHGVTLAAMSATGLSAYWPLFEPRVPGFVHIPSPYPYRYDAPPGVSQGIAAANELEQAILREGADTVAMFLAEPVQGAGGVIVPQDDYFPRIREICDQYDVLLVADEVITAFGRTGTLFALDHWHIQPDIVQFAKAITSGYIPFGGIGINDTIASTLDDDGRAWMHAYTYSAHPVGCAVAMRNLRIIEDEDLPGQCAEKGDRLLAALRSALGDHLHVGDIRGKGLMCAVELVADRATKESFPAGDKVGPRVREAAAQGGLFSRVKADTYVLAPAAVITDDHLDRTVEILRDSIRAVLG